MAKSSTAGTTNSARRNGKASKKEGASRVRGSKSDPLALVIAGKGMAVTWERANREAARTSKKGKGD